ncbi:hypothetical protein K469DRAFT_687610 [Zopfia rhizophila CBS 207.26]|uniref:ATP-grasp domain-containing protein n=1 Tax=Zopfia rhizophila CBS 207.26 TaxID=1314779 RepID=A0A6A6E431_9PEZI|nr:hypothetical protein K469DRAFT_687610 [Zopfia rhizophila CBS 207.26]
MVAKDNHKALLRLEEAGSTAHLEILEHPPHLHENGTSLWSLDILVTATQHSEGIGLSEQPPTLILSGTDPPLVEFLMSVPSHHAVEHDHQPLPIRLLFSTRNGYVIRSDFLEQRLECSEHISRATSFLFPLQPVNAVHQDITLPALGKTLSKAIGAVVPLPSATFQDLDIDLRNRLSFSWLVPTPLKPRRIAWVQGREDIDCIERALKAAAALGIILVILDESSHWLQDPHTPWAYLREAFVEVDITPNIGFAGRVANAVRTYPHKIDGIVTISDVRLPGVARACQMVGLPTESPEAYEIAGNKGHTRLLETVGANESFVLSSADELETFLEQRQPRHGPPLRYPLVVKPVVGWCSDCVSKVQNYTELTIAVQKASARHADSAKRSTAVVIEPYVDGPEVDANFALLDGEILFYDVNDDFPSPADVPGAGFNANFQETQNVMPSGLPTEEIIAIRDQMRQSMLRQGFRSGVFHCEGRVRNSRVKYAVKDGNVVDLTPTNGDGSHEEPQVYLHEINARPPGYLESVAVLFAYGIDYYALRMLMALGPAENARVRALSQSFLNGPQFHLSLMILQQTRAGIMKTADAAKEFLEEHPDIKTKVVDYYTRKKGGDVLDGPNASALWWIAYFSVISRESRGDLLRQVDFIQQNFKYEIEE